MGTQIIGTGSSTTTHTLLWYFPTASPTDLSLTGAYIGSTIFATNCMQYAGEINTYSDSPHAVLWTAADNSYVDLHPAGFDFSLARAMDATHQIGVAGHAPNSAFQAILWSGTADSAINLNPAGFATSSGLDVSGAHQVGWAGDSDMNMQHAMLWSGTAASAIDLNPPGFDVSVAEGVAGNQQVGYAVGPSINNDSHAMLWTGTAASAVDLNPNGFRFSEIQKTNGLLEAGLAARDYSHSDVFVWAGTPASAVDLSDFVPSQRGYPNDFRGANIDAYGDVISTIFANVTIPVVWYNGNVYTGQSPDWTNPSNWLSGLPASGKDILIIPTSPSSYSLTYSQSPALGKLTLDNPGGGTVTLTVSSGTLSASAILIGVVGNATLHQSGGTIQTPLLAIGNNQELDLGTGTGTLLVSAGSLSADTILLGSTLGGTGLLAYASPTALVTSSLSIAHDATTYFGTLDLTTSKLILQSATASDKQSKLPDLTSAIKAQAITSTTATQDPQHYALALLDNADLHLQSFGNQPVDQNSLLLTLAHQGDANADNIIDIQDQSLVTNHWQSQEQTWSTGDLNLDGIVDLQDLSLITNNWQQSSAFSQLPITNDQLPPAPTPEPTTLLLLLPAFTLLPRKRPHDFTP